MHECRIINCNYIGTKSISKILDCQIINKAKIGARYCYLCCFVYLIPKTIVLRNKLNITTQDI